MNMTKVQEKTNAKSVQSRNYENCLLLEIVDLLKEIKKKVKP